MHKVTVHYDKKHKIILNVGCAPVHDEKDPEGSLESHMKFASMAYLTLQRERPDGQQSFPVDRYPDYRSMMVGDIVEWETSPICAFCDWYGWHFIDKCELDMILSLPEDIRRLPFSRIKQYIARN